MRNMLFSGLATELQRKYKVSILTHQHNEYLDHAAKDNNLEIIQILPESLKKKRLKIEGYFLSSRRARLRLDNNKSFRLMTKAPEVRKKDYILSNDLLYKVLQKITWKKTQKNYYDKQLAESIKKYGITDVIIQGYSTPEAMVVGVTASQLNCKVWVINWSWKDFYVNEYIPFKVNGLFTWSDELKQNYIEYNKHIDQGLFEAIGNLSFDKMYNYKPTRALNYYAAKYGFSESTRIILYSMVHPAVYADEHMLIKRIYDQLENSTLAGDFIFLMKPNPMDKVLTRLFDIEIKNRLITLENLWEYSQKDDFNMITDEGQTEWLDLIYYSDINISVASTVTIEYLIMNKPVINVLFDATLNLNEDFVRLYEAPYYASCKNLDTVKPVKSIDKIEQTLLNLLHKEKATNEVEKIIKIDGNSIPHFLNKINY